MIDRKKLIVIFFAVLLVLLVLLMMNKKEYQEQHEQSMPKQEITQNVGEVENNGGNVVAYDGYIYYIAKKNKGTGFENHLCRRSIQDDIEEDLENLEMYYADRKLMIYGNRLFFHVIDEMYVKDLSQIERSDFFSRGFLDYIKDGRAIISYIDNTFLSYYYPDTFVINRSGAIIQGKVGYIGSDEKNVYYYSNDSETKKKLIAFNLEKNDCDFLTDIVMSGDKMIHTVLTPNDIYVILDGEDSRIYQYDIKNASSGESRVHFHIKACVADKDDLLICTDDMKLYRVPRAMNKLEVGKVPSGGKNLYCLIEETEDNAHYAVLYKNGEKFAKIPKALSGELSNIHIDEVVSQVYVRFDSGQERNLFWRIDKEGKLLCLND